MENVSHLFLFKGKLQTQSPSSPRMCSLPATLPPHAADMPFHPMWAPPKPATSCLPSAVCRNKWLLVFVHMTKLVATPLTQT